MNILIIFNRRDGGVFFPFFGGNYNIIILMLIKFYAVVFMVVKIHP